MQRVRLVPHPLDHGPAAQPLASMLDRRHERVDDRGTQLLDGEPGPGHERRAGCLRV